MKSIRVFLVTVILAVVTLFSFISALRGYETSLQEVERMLMFVEEPTAQTWQSEEDAAAWPAVL